MVKDASVPQSAIDSSCWTSLLQAMTLVSSGFRAIELSNWQAKAGGSGQREVTITSSMFYWSDSWDPQMCSRATCPGNGRDLSRVVRVRGPHKDLPVLLGLLLYYYGAGTCLSLSFSGLWSCPSECRVPWTQAR